MPSYDERVAARIEEFGLEFPEFPASLPSSWRSVYLMAPHTSAVDVIDYAIFGEMRGFLLRAPLDMPTVVSRYRAFWAWLSRVWEEDEEVGARIFAGTCCQEVLDELDKHGLAADDYLEIFPAQVQEKVLTWDNEYFL